jgi:hypothetical protein
MPLIGISRSLPVRYPNESWIPTDRKFNPLPGRAPLHELLIRPIANGNFHCPPSPTVNLPPHRRIVKRQFIERRGALIASVFGFTPWTWIVPFERHINPTCALRGRPLACPSHAKTPASVPAAIPSACIALPLAYNSHNDNLRSRFSQTRFIRRHRRRGRIQRL